VEIETTVDGKAYRGDYVVKENARGKISVVVNYDGAVSEALVLGRADPAQTARSLLEALVAKSRLSGG
jgi:hypothetical protein